MKSASALCAIVILGAYPAVAQSAPTLPFELSEGQLVLTTLGQTLSLPAPDWADQVTSVTDLADTISARFVEEQGQAHLEIYPRGEGEAFWSTLYGARLSNQSDMSLSDFRNVVINVYVQSCQPETVAVFQLEPDDGDSLPPLGYVCGAYRDDFTDFAGQGEVMVVGFYKSAAGLGMVYQEWRGDAFDAENPASWPVAADLVEARIAQLKADVSLTLAD